MTAHRFWLVATITTLLGVSADGPFHALGAAGEPAPKWATANDLGGTDRFLAHLSTDKPIYRDGENALLRGVILHANSHRPLANGYANANIQVLGPKGDMVTSGWAQAQLSTFGFSWAIPEGTAGGEYTFKVSFPNEGYAPAERKFEVRDYRPPRLNSQIVFLRDGYGPGDSVTATLDVKRAEGGIPSGATVTASARVDGADVFQGTTRVDATGKCSVTFALPAKIERGDGTLAMVIEDGGVVETASKTIPILVNSIDLAFYPEGGDLIAGLPARIYFEARTPAQKPADLEGIIVGPDEKTVATVKSEHEGRGRFTFTPEKSTKRGSNAASQYALRITKPSGITRSYTLPEIKNSGGVIATIDDITPAGKPIRLRVGSTERGAVKLTVSQRDNVLASQSIEGATGRLVDTSIKVPTDVSGVLIATLWDAKDKPLAERLVYRAPAHAVQIEVTANKKSYVPGDAVELTVTTTDEQDNPVGATVGINVTDESVLEMIDKREQAPRLPVMVLLEDEVRELADAHVYLDAKNPKAPLATDLLLGTQGWRRFALVSWGEFLTKQEDKARRVLALRNLPPPQVAWESAEPGAAVSAPAMEREEKLAMVPRSAARPRAMPAPPPAPAPMKKAEARKAPLRVMAQPRPGGPAPRQHRQAGGLALRGRGDMADDIRAEPVPVAYTREYAHQGQPGRSREERSDFTETVYWNAGVATDAKTGKATVKFALSDSVTSFRASADAFDKDGALGSGNGVLTSVEPFYAEPKLPLQVTQGDIIALPVGVVNSTPTDLNDGALNASAAKGITISGGGNVKFKANSRQRTMLRVDVGRYVGKSPFTIEAKGGNYNDKVTRELEVRPLGFPIEIASGGMLEAGGSSTVNVDIPSTVVPGSVTTSIAAFPAPLGNLTAALERLIQEPNGCFEQTSSTNYPLVMAAQYFTTHAGVDPSLIERSRDTMKRGYDRLRGFECKKDGYEWFGEDPGHEALSAYGMLEFIDMSKVMQVDMQMVDRTRQWVLAKRDGTGGFKHERRALHTWLVDADLHNGYITWALLESGERGIEREAKFFLDQAMQSPSSYVAALGANVALRTGDKGTARKLMDKLVAKQTKEGAVDGSKTSIVGSSGEGLLVETTSLAVLAWLQEPAYAGAVEQGVRYLNESCKGGRYGSTQSTVLALRAILAYDKSRAGSRRGGSLQLQVDGKDAGPATSFAADAQEGLKLADIADKLTPGKHSITLKVKGGSRMPFTVAVHYNAATPASSADCKVDLETSMSDGSIDEGDVTEINVTMKNLAGETVPSPVAIIGVPGGLEVRHDQLKELKKANRIAAYEVLGRDVVLYWRELTAGQVVKLPVSLVAAVPGTYTAPASRAYLYYGDEHKKWVNGSKVEIAPRAR